MLVSVRASRQQDRRGKIERNECCRWSVARLADDGAGAKWGVCACGVLLCARARRGRGGVGRGGSTRGGVGVAVSLLRFHPDSPLLSLQSNPPDHPLHALKTEV